MVESQTLHFLLVRTAEASSILGVIPYLALTRFQPVDLGVASVTISNKLAASADLSLGIERALMGEWNVTRTVLTVDESRVWIFILTRLTLSQVCCCDFSICTSLLQQTPVTSMLRLLLR